LAHSDRLSPFISVSCESINELDRGAESEGKYRTTASLVSTRDDRADVTAHRPITARVPTPSQPAPRHPPVGVAEDTGSDEATGGNAMTQHPQSAPSKQGEEMVKRLLLIADLLAKGTLASPNVLQKPQESREKTTRAQSHVSSSL
jgi:hypothetical protein